MSSAKSAMLKYCRRHQEKLMREQGIGRKNKRPEYDLVKELLVWLKANGFSCNTVESKAVYSFRAGRYLRPQVRPGFSDIAGACPNGIGCFIEAKAPGRRNKLSQIQRAFLIDKISMGCFAVVVDSIELLAKLWIEFEHRRRMEPELAKALLYRILPVEKESTPLQFD